jgi:hypothetical protein
MSSRTADGFLEFYRLRLRRNWPGYFGAFYPYLFAVTVAATLDFLSTWRFMSEGSPEDELHPVIRLVSLTFGPVIGPLIGKLGQLLALLFLTVVFRPFARVIFVPVIVIYLYAAWYNTWGVNFYTPLWLRLLS